VVLSQHSDLASKLDAHVAAVRMYERNALTVKDLESIQSLRDRPVKAAETLLNIILEQPFAVYECFLDVLKQTGQQHIYQTLVEGAYKGEYNAIVAIYATEAIFHDVPLSVPVSRARVCESITHMQLRRHHMNRAQFSAIYTVFQKNM